MTIPSRCIEFQYLLHLPRLDARQLALRPATLAHDFAARRRPTKEMSAQLADVRLAGDLLRGRSRSR